MPITTILFDLDDTLYPASSGVWKLIKDRMNIFMHEELGIPWDQIPLLRERYFREYGTTLRGLQTHYHLDVNAYLSFVHDIPLSQYLIPDRRTRDIIKTLPQKKYIFTNADADHAKRVLKTLDLTDCFSGIIDITAVEPYCKPMEQAFNIALEVAGEPEAVNCVLIDDLPTTTKAGKELGFYTILFAKTGDPGDANAFLDDFRDLPAIISEINN
ncbi:MAG TPA: pyrimidine 5'-nucleotidase [Anaerolineales bacterium]|nr:pyrimidine 5'-nucleotidase [Anaerolineales bacterium]